MCSGGGPHGLRRRRANWPDVDHAPTELANCAAVPMGDDGRSRLRHWRTVSDLNRNRLYHENSFSPRVMSLIADDFTRHGADIAGIATALQRRARNLVRNVDDARELARLCAAMQQLSQRIMSDAFKARSEVGKLNPGEAGHDVSVCICGNTIEDGSCPTGGNCSRGVNADLTA
jgi:hypothetical protein